MSDVTADGAATHRPRATLVPSWHHVNDDASPAGQEPDGPTSRAEPVVPEPPVSLAPSRQPAM